MEMNNDGGQPQTATGRVPNRLAWVILAMALAFAVFVRWRLAEFPLERDEGEYAYAGQLILQGVPPYSLVYNMKLPGTYLAYAGLMAIFGQSTVGVHLGLLAVTLATIVLLFFLTRDLFDSLTGAVAAAVFAVLSTSFGVLGMAAHATHFVALFGVAGAWVLWRAMRSGKISLFLAAGALLGLAFLMKQQGAFLLGFGGLATLFFCAQRRPFFSTRNVAACMAYATGAVLPFAVTCLWLWMAGTFSTFWFWTVQYARTYVSQIPLNVAAEIFWQSAQGVVGANWPLWALATLGALSLARSRDVPQRRTFVFAFLAFSFLCVCPGFYFRQHYFIVLLPGVAILAAVGGTTLVGLASRFRFGKKATPHTQPSSRSRRRELRKAKPVEHAGALDGRGLLVGLAALIPAAAIVFPVWQQRGYYFFWSPEQACRRIYGANPFVESPVIADYIKTHSRLDDRIAVLGSEPEVFFDANRRSATGYIYTYALMESHPFARTMQNEMIAEIEAAKPKFLVIVNVPTSWLARDSSDMHILEWLSRYAAAAYRPVGLVEIPPTGQAEYTWDADVAGAQPHTNCYLWIFRRNP
jgi:hypothetical protein